MRSDIDQLLDRLDRLTASVEQINVRTAPVQLQAKGEVGERAAEVAVEHDDAVDGDPDGLLRPVRDPDAAAARGSGLLDLAGEVAERDIVGDDNPDPGAGQLDLSHGSSSRLADGAGTPSSEHTVGEPTDRAGGVASSPSLALSEPGRPYPLTFIAAIRDALPVLLDAAEERDRLREQIAAVRALADGWDEAAVKGGPRNYAGSLFATAASDLRAALGTSTPATEGGEE